MIGFLYFCLESVFSLAALESKLVSYVKDPAAAEQPFDVSSVPKISRAQAAQEAARESVQSPLFLFAKSCMTCRTEHTGHHRCSIGQEDS